MTLAPITLVTLHSLFPYPQITANLLAFPLSLFSIKTQSPFTGTEPQVRQHKPYYCIFISKSL